MNISKGLVSTLLAAIFCLFLGDMAAASDFSDENYDDATTVQAIDEVSDTASRSWLDGLFPGITGKIDEKGSELIDKAAEKLPEMAGKAREALPGMITDVKDTAANAREAVAGWVESYRGNTWDNLEGMLPDESEDSADDAMTSLTPEAVEELTPSDIYYYNPEVPEEDQQTPTIVIDNSVVDNSVHNEYHYYGKTEEPQDSLPSGVSSTTTETTVYTKQVLPGVELQVNKDGSFTVGSIVFLLLMSGLIGVLIIFFLRFAYLFLHRERQ